MKAWFDIADGNRGVVKVIEVQNQLMFECA